MVHYELEIIVNTSPKNLSKFAVVEIPINDARKLIKEVYGISLDTRISDISTATQLLKETKKLTPKEALEFYKKIIKLNPSNKVYKFIKPPVPNDNNKK